jgi:hypothetical protein
MDLLIVIQTLWWSVYSLGPACNPQAVVPTAHSFSHTDKKENKIFLIYREIQTGTVAKSNMTIGLQSSYMAKYLRISSYIRKPFLIYDFATVPF